MLPPKARGIQLGNPKQAKANKHEADRYAKVLPPVLVELRDMPVEKIADDLTRRKVATSRGGQWHGRTRGEAARSAVLVMIAPA